MARHNVNSARSSAAAEADGPMPSPTTLFSLMERRQGVRIVEVRQRIVAVVLGRTEARQLRTRASAPAREIVRQYVDPRERAVMASIGLYPSDRFSHNTRFHIEVNNTRNHR